MATKSVRDFTHRLRCGQGSNLLMPCTPHQHSPLHLKADKKSSRHCSFPSECSHDSIRPQLSFLVPSFEAIKTPKPGTCFTTPPSRSNRSSGLRLVHRVRIPKSRQRL